MKFGVYLPNHGDYFDARLMAQLAFEAEAAGWDGFFIWDHLNHPHYLDLPFADPWVLLTVISLATQKIRVGAMVTPISRRRPWKLAKETVTLDHLSGGRLTFGAGLGTHQVELSDLGDEGDPRRRAEMLDEGLEIVNGLWSGAEYEFTGKYFHIQRTRFNPASFQKPRIPVWIAGIWPKKGPLARAARWDGYFPLGGIRENRFLMPEEISCILNSMKEVRESQAPFDIIASGYTDGLNPSAEARYVDEYDQAGATWWLEALDPWRLSSLEARKRIKLGPPRI
jgi:alkanesulfonate monooxygenase SsuD/methylene tetrahydromethanopterin reductase-like flavin-dependent oxidoreductase (luciferase family)